MKYKIGDRVKIKKMSRINNHGTTGRIGTIVEIDEDQTVPFTIAFNGGTFTGCRFYENELEKIEDEPEQYIDYGVNRYGYQDGMIHRLETGKWIPVPQLQGTQFIHEQACEQIFNESLTQKVSKTMSSIVKKIKDLNLKPEDRVLRKHGFEDEQGKMTDQTKDMMLEELLTEKWAARRLEVAASAKVIESEEK